ncbi:hypothetical protein IAD21_01988 [Abditibacteriota bacterium]|nr:hypothetical protein IAD21_01988 [Abditibacteriota bacterium]
MKSSSPPSRSTSAAPRPGGKSAKPKTVSPPLTANERGVQRRARKKVERRRKNWLVWLGFAAATAVIVGAATGVRSELKSAKGRVASKQVTLKALQTQLAQGRKRLSAFNGGSGRERALAENGFIKPSERILLFPRNNKSNR